MRALTLAFLTLGLTAALLTSPLLNRTLLTPAKALTVEKRAAPDRAATTPADPTATQVAWEA